MKTNINKNQIKLPGGTIGQALVKMSSADYDYDWGSVSSSISIQSVNIFDDFVSKIEASGSTSKILSTYNWSPFSNNSALSAEQSASDSTSFGTVTVSNTDLGSCNGFYTGSPKTGSADPSNVTYGIFDIEFRVYIPTAVLAEAFFFGFASGDLSSNFLTSITKRIGITADNTGWKGIVGTGAAVSSTSATAITGNSWEKLRITYNGTVAEFFVNGVSIGTISQAITGDCSVCMFTKKNTLISSSNFIIDYMKLNYQVTR